MAFEIGNREEYVALKTCVSLYDTLRFIIEDCKNNVIKNTYKTHVDLLTIKLDKIQKFLDLNLKIKNSILISLQVSMNATIAIQKELQVGAEEINFKKVIELANHFCQGYQEVYKDWMNVITLYDNSHPVDLEDQETKDNHIRKVLFALAVLGIIGISFYLGACYSKNKYDKFLEQDSEDQENYDNSFLEDIDVEQILARKL